MIIENFTPWLSLIGGLTIGISAAALLFFNGKIAGISGISKSLLAEFETAAEKHWRQAFTIGLIIGGAITVYFAPEMTAKTLNLPLLQMIGGGLIVGFGTAMGNGCTSGHGVCGLARRSRRSLASVLTFMGSGFVTMYLMTHLFSLERFY